MTVSTKRGKRAPRGSLTVEGDQRPAHWQGTWQAALPPELAQRDALIRQDFADTLPWGMEASIDLFGCDPHSIRDAQQIRAFAIALCDHIQMRRYQDPLVVHFGADERVSGFSLVQLIQTSAISAHFIEQVDAVCLNIFSCACYLPYAAAAFCQQWFGAQEVALSLAFRGPGEGGSRCWSHR